MTGRPAASELPLGRPIRIELRRVRVPLREPIVAAHGTEVVRDVTLVRAIGADGVEGWGECEALTRPTYTSEWQDGAWLVLRDLLAPAALADRAPGITGHPMATAALECALVDLALRQQGVSLSVVLGATAGRVGSRAVVGIRDSVDEVVRAVGERVDAGHRAVKLKIRPGSDLEPLRAVRSAWPDLDLAADANGSYDRAGARTLVAAVEPLGLDHLEQPLAAADLPGHAELRRAGIVPIGLDEGAPDAAAVEVAIALAAVDVVNVKPARVGGLAATLALCGLLGDTGIRAVCGGMYELGVGRAVTLAVAALPAFDGPADLGPSSAYVATDLTDAITLAPDGTLAVPVGVGIGATPDPGRLDAATVDVCVVDRT